MATTTTDGAKLITAFKSMVQVLLDCDLTHQARENVRKMKNYMELVSDLPLVKKGVGTVYTRHKEAVIKHVQSRDVEGLREYFLQHEDAKFLAEYNTQVMSVIEELKPDDANRCWTCLDSLSEQ